MEWFEELASKLLSSLPASASANPALDQLAALAVIIDSKHFKGKDLKEVRHAFQTELDQFVASGSAPLLATRYTDEILHHHRRICDLAELVKLPMDKDSRRTVSKAIKEEGFALHDAYDAWFEHIMRGPRPARPG